MFLGKGLSDGLAFFLRQTEKGFQNKRGRLLVENMFSFGNRHDGFAKALFRFIAQ